MKEIRDLNIMFAKSGSGGCTTRLSIPIKWIKAMGVTPDDRMVEVVFCEDKQTITIIKK